MIEWIKNKLFKRDFIPFDEFVRKEQFKADFAFQQKARKTWMPKK